MGKEGEVMREGREEWEGSGGGEKEREGKECWEGGVCEKIEVSKLKKKKPNKHREYISLKTIAINAYFAPKREYSFHKVLFSEQLKKRKESYLHCLIFPYK